MKLLSFLFTLFCVSMSFGQPHPDMLWTRVFGTSGFDYAFSVRQTLDNGFALCGAANSSSSGSSGYLIRLNSDGDTLWTRIYEGNPTLSTNNVLQTPDRGFVLSGRVLSATDSGDAHLMKTDSLGIVQWEHIYGGIDREGFNSFVRTSDNGFACVGYTKSYGSGSSDVYLVKTDTMGDTLWIRTFGDTLDQSGYEIEQPEEGGFIISGVTGLFGSGSVLDILLIKTDDNGNLQWMRTYGGSEDERPNAVHNTPDGGYLISGETSSFGAGGYDFYLIRTDRSGDTLWTRTFGFSGDDFARDMVLTVDGGCMVIGTYWPVSGNPGDMLLWKADSLGNSQWFTRYGGSASYETGYGMCKVTSGGYILVGSRYISNSPTNWDVYVVRTGSDLSPANDRQVLEPPQSFLLSAFPNPFNAMTTIRYDVPVQSQVELRVFDVLGRSVGELFSGVQSAGSHNVTWNGSAVASGLYFVQLKAGDFFTRQKVMLLK